MKSFMNNNDWSLFKIDKVVIQNQKNEQLIFLRQVGGEIIFPIAVGIYEAAALKNLLDNPVFSRPLTHELIINAVKVLDGKVDYALIESLLGAVFYAKLGLSDSRGRQCDIDCRPSDALCVAQEAGIPIFVTKEVLEKVSSALP